MIDLTALPIDITNHIINFRNLLNSSWPYLDALMKVHDWDEDGNFSDDWMQVNWEFLVERELLGKKHYLMPLEWNSRITSPSALTDYKVTCESITKMEMKDWVLKSNNYEGEELLISGFRSVSGDSYGLYPPFDFVEVTSVNRKKIYIIQINCCRFLLKPI